MTLWWCYQLQAANRANEAIEGNQGVIKGGVSHYGDEEDVDVQLSQD